MSAAGERGAAGESARSSAGIAPRIRPMRHEDLDDVFEMERLAFPRIPEERLWKRWQLEAHVDVFPEGQWVAELEGRIVGSCTNMRTRWETATQPHTWNGITDRGRLTTHDPEGDVLYGTEVMVHPEARRRGIGRRLFERRYQYVRENDLRAFVTGGRLNGYGQHAERLTPEQYVDAVVNGELTDPVLTPDLKWGMTPIGVLCGYMVDPPSLHHASLIVWENPELRSEA